MPAYGRVKMVKYSVLMRKNGGSWEYGMSDGKVWETTDRSEANAQAKRAREHGYETKIRSRTVG